MVIGSVVVFWIIILSILFSTVDCTLWSLTAVCAAWYFLRFGLFVRLKKTALATWLFLWMLQLKCLVCEKVAFLWPVCIQSLLYLVGFHNLQNRNNCKWKCYC